MTAAISQEAHVQEDLEIGRLGVDAGKNGGLAVATDGVDVAAVNRAVQCEPVDADQHADDEHHNRNATLGGVAEQQLLEGLGFYLVVAFLDGGVVTKISAFI